MEFEESINKLQDIASKLENPNLSMDEGLKLYEEGISLATNCYKQLNEVKGKITILKQDLDNFIEESFE